MIVEVKVGVWCSLCSSVARLDHRHNNVEAEVALLMSWHALEKEAAEKEAMEKSFKASALKREDVVVTSDDHGPIAGIENTFCQGEKVSIVLTSDLDRILAQAARVEGIEKKVEEAWSAAEGSAARRNGWRRSAEKHYKERRALEERVKHLRRDAERSGADSLPGIDMLRSWLRHLHMDFTPGWDQDTGQDDIAKLLGEHPRGHAREFKIV